MMPFALAFVTVSLIQTIRCYTYQTKPLFLSFSDLAALESNSLFYANKLNSDSAGLRMKKTFVLKCHEDGIEVVLRVALLDPGRPVQPEQLSLGPLGAANSHDCMAKVSENGDYIIRAALTDCGGEVTFTQSALLYKNLLLYSPPRKSPGDGIRADGAAVPVQCQYKRRYTVSSEALKPTWTPMISTQSELLQLDFNLRLMTEDWSSERDSPVYILGDTVNILASVAPPLSLRLYVNNCVASLTSDVNSDPSHRFIDHQGCFTDSQLQGSSSWFLPRVRDDLLHIQLQPFLFLQDRRRHTVYIKCNLEAESISTIKPVKKNCSFINGRWRSVDGDDGVCVSCRSDSSTSVHRRAPRSQIQQLLTELQKATCLGPVMFLTHKYLHRV